MCGVCVLKGKGNLKTKRSDLILKKKKVKFQREKRIIGNEKRKKLFSTKLTS